MRRAELEHAIRAATEILAADRVIVIGSQAILGSFGDDELPAEATMSIEVDIAPMHDDDAGALATRIDALLGEWSQFHETHGFYVQGVGRETAVLPTGWEDRLVAIAGRGRRSSSGSSPTAERRSGTAPAGHLIKRPPDRALGRSPRAMSRFTLGCCPVVRDCGWL